MNALAQKRNLFWLLFPFVTNPSQAQPIEKIHFPSALTVRYKVHSCTAGGNFWFQAPKTPPTTQPTHPESSLFFSFFFFPSFQYPHHPFLASQEKTPSMDGFLEIGDSPPSLPLSGGGGGINFVEGW